MKHSLFIPLLTIAALLASCADRRNPYDASGVFEADEIILSAEASGRILWLNAAEGTTVTEGETLGCIDSLQIYLRKLQLEKNISSVRSSRPDIDRQLAVLYEQLDKLRTEQRRVQNLLAAQAATPKQLDDINSQILVLEKQIDAQNSTLRRSTAGIDAQSSALEIQIAQLDDQLRKCTITAPISGTILARYAHRGELAVTGKPLLRIADTEHIHLKAYFTLGQLRDITLGQQVTVIADFGGDNLRRYPGTISWISPQSEFTPKNIQTSSDRENLVYAVKISVINDGYIKIGMYGHTTLSVTH